jgi:hypothetical protein
VAHTRLGWHLLGHKVVLSFCNIPELLLKVGWFQTVWVCQRVAENSAYKLVTEEALPSAYV